jgi:glycerol-3-phosphate cytidylyltransferase
MVKIGFIASSFDLLHAGHIIALREAKENCDFLVVGFNVEPETKKPVQSAKERLIQLRAVKYVDMIVPYYREQQMYEYLKNSNVNIRFLGDDYIGKSFTGDDLRIEIRYLSRSHGYSTTELKDRIKNYMEEK